MTCKSTNTAMNLEEVCRSKWMQSGCFCFQHRTKWGTPVCTYNELEQGT